MKLASDLKVEVSRFQATLWTDSLFCCWDCVPNDSPWCKWFGGKEKCHSLPSLSLSLQNFTTALHQFVGSPLFSDYLYSSVSCIKLIF